MDMLLDLSEKLIGSGYLKDLSLVLILVGTLRTHIKKIESSVDGIRSELHDLKGIFREQNKRISNLEGAQEATFYRLDKIERGA